MHRKHIRWMDEMGLHYMDKNKYKSTTGNVHFNQDGGREGERIRIDKVRCDKMGNVRKKQGGEYKKVRKAGVGGKND